MERCVGCGIEDARHPIVGITKASELPAPLDAYQLPVAASSRGFVAYGVCGLCYQEPSHRRRVLKMSFFTREDLAQALALAGSNAVGGQVIL